MKPMPRDRTCRISRGGCGRPVITVREPAEYKTPFGGQLRTNRNSRLVVIHDDEIEEKPNRVPARTSSDNFSRLRFGLELKCAALQEQLKAAAPMKAHAARAGVKP